MREWIRELVTAARRAAWMEPASSTSAAAEPREHAVISQLGSRAISTAQVAAMMHMDQASKLRASMTEYRKATDSAPQAITPPEVAV